MLEWWNPAISDFRMQIADFCEELNAETLK
jgi:hypothetical protein